MVATYLRGIGLISGTQNGTTSYYLYNAHGDVVQLAGTSGAITKTYDYDAFGNERTPDEADTNPFRYCGEYWDAETQTLYLRARYYHPSTGRFISEDSLTARQTNIFDPYGEYKDYDLIGGVYVDWTEQQYIINDPLSLNLYTYTQNNPTMYKDPSGNNAIAAGAAVGTAVCPGVGTVVGIAIGAAATVAAAIIIAEAKSSKTKIPSKLKDGGKVKTPDTHPGEFQKNKDGSYTHTKSGWTFKKDKSNHGGEHYDASPKNGKTGDYCNVYPDGTIR